MRPLAIVAALGALAFPVVPAQAAGFSNIVVSTSEDGTTSQSNFPVDTPVLYVSADLDDVASTSKLTFSWISVDSHGVAPANYVIDQVSMDAGGNNQVYSNLTKPTAGWPVGTYRVDLAIDGTVENSVDFSIP